MSTLSHSSTASHAAEALLNRARRLSSNAYERTFPPVTFAEGEDNNPHISHYDTLRPRSNMPILLRRSSTRPSSLSKPLSTSTAIATPTSPSTITTRITNTPVIISDAEGNSSIPTDQTPSQAPAPEGSNQTSSSSQNNTFLDPSRAHTLPCTTSLSSSQSTRLTSLSVAARPRALTLETSREVRDSVGESMNESKSPKDQHRKHRSENGGSLVRDILIVLRQSTELESPTFNHRQTTDLTTIPDHHGNNSPLLSSVSPEQKDQQHSIQTAVEECELDGRRSPVLRKSALSPNLRIPHPLNAEMASKSNSDLSTSLKHVPESVS